MLIYFVSQVLQPQEQSPKMLSQTNSISQTITKNPILSSLVALQEQNRKQHNLYLQLVRGQVVINQNSLVHLILIGLKDDLSFPISGKSS